jgi:hypothetical protein
LLERLGRLWVFARDILVGMDKDCIVYDGYLVYRVATTRGVRFLIDKGCGETDRIIIPMFRIAKGIVRASNWDGDTSKDAEIEERYGRSSDYECLQSNVEASKKAYGDVGHGPIRTTMVIVGDDNHFGIAVFHGIVVARIKEEEVPLHC